MSPPDTGGRNFFSENFGLGIVADSLKWNCKMFEANASDLKYFPCCYLYSQKDDFFFVIILDDFFFVIIFFISSRIRTSVNFCKESRDYYDSCHIDKHQKNLGFVFWFHIVRHINYFCTRKLHHRYLGWS